MKKDWSSSRKMFENSGIPSAWVNHVKDCESKFWKMFHGVRRRQEESLEEYKQKGYITMIGWGFRRHGYLNRNTIFNSHIQGPAYHCLMDAINHLVPLKRTEAWRTKMPGQIHDAIFFDAHRGEQRRVVEAVTEEMTVNVRRRNKWLVVPLEVEWERGEKNWLEMEKLSLQLF
jgi:DNA polymerase I-like protein with 3'-5' exonuclease and polymerase domains